jgi:hypothetical protein
MSATWAAPYQAPTTLNAPRRLGPFPRGPVLAIFWGTLAAALLYLLSGVWLSLPYRAILPALVLAAALRFAIPHKRRPFVWWLHAYLRRATLPAVLEGSAVQDLHVRLGGVAAAHVEAKDGDTVRAVIEVDQTLNLALADEETLGSYVRRLGAFFNGLRFRVHIVIRSRSVDMAGALAPLRAHSHARPRALADFLQDQVAELGLLERAWYIAVGAPSRTLLDQRVDRILAGLRRAGLHGKRLTDGLADTLHRSWTQIPKGAGSLVGPQLVRIGSDQVEVDGQLVRTLLLDRFPRSVEPLFLAGLLDANLPADVALLVEPQDDSLEIAKLDGLIGNWEAAQEITYSRHGKRDPDLADQILDAKRTRRALARHQLRVFLVRVTITLRARTNTGLDRLQATVVDLLTEQIGDMPVQPATLEQDLGLRQAVPTGDGVVGLPLRIDTPALARVHPFTASSIVMHGAGAVPIGMSEGSGRPVWLNLWGMPNPHMLVLALSGAGKGFLVKVMLYRLLLLDPDCEACVVQAEKDEYGPLASMQELGGKKIDVDDPARLERDLVQPWDGFWRDQSRLRVYNLVGMAAEHRGEAIEFILRTEEHYARFARKYARGVIAVDELGIVLADPTAAHAIETGYRRLRDAKRAMIGISQRPRDLLGHQRGQVLADIALTHVYLRQQPTELAAVSSALGLSKAMQDFLEEADQGQGILKADRQRIGFRLEAAPFEFDMAQTG